MSFDRDLLLINGMDKEKPRFAESGPQQKKTLAEIDAMIAERRRGRIISSGENIQEVSQEEGLWLEEREIRQKLEYIKRLSKEEVERLEERLAEIARERNPKKDEPRSSKSSVVKLH